MKKILNTLLVLMTSLVCFTNLDALTVNEREIKDLASKQIGGETITYNIYIIGSHMFTNSISIDKIMTGSRTIQNGEDNIIYFYNTVTKTWTNAIDGSSVTLPSTIEITHMNLDDLTTDYVYNETELNEALSMADIETVILGDSFDVANTPNISGKTLKGNGKTLTSTSNQALSVTGIDNYNTILENINIKFNYTGNNITCGITTSGNVIFNNLTITGAQYGLSIADEATLNGIINLSGNTKAAIEVFDATINGTGTITFTNEEYGVPTIKSDDTSIINFTNMTKSTTVVSGETHYYLNSENAKLDNINSLNSALKNGLTDLTLEGDIENINGTLEVPAGTTINGNGNTLTFTEEIQNEPAIVVGDTEEEVTEQIVIENVNIVLPGNTSTEYEVYGIGVANSSDVIIRNVTVNNGDTGIYIVNSNVILEENIDVSNNLIGILVTTEGTGTSSLSPGNANITNTTEDYLSATVWSTVDNVTVTTNATTPLYKQMVRGEDEEGNIVSYDLYYIDYANAPEFDGTVDGNYKITNDLSAPSTITKNATLNIISQENREIKITADIIDKPERGNIKVYLSDISTVIDLIETDTSVNTLSAGDILDYDLEIMADTVGIYEVDINIIDETTGDTLETLTYTLKFTE